MKTLRNAVCMAVVSTMASLPAAASDTGSGWDYVVQPYIFLPALDVDSTIAGQTVPVDMSFGDVWDSFDVLAFSIRGEAWHGPYGGVADFYWVDLDGNFGPNDTVNVQIEEWYLDLLGGYRCVHPGKFERPTTVDFTGGLRAHGLKQKINIPDKPTLGGDNDWVDIMLGCRVIHPIAETWNLALRGDIGGFDLTGGTDLNWSLTGGVGWQFARDWLLDGGYRAYGIDYSTGTGLSNFGIDGVEHGLYLGVTWAP